MSPHHPQRAAFKSSHVEEIANMPANLSSQPLSDRQREILVSSSGMTLTAAAEKLGVTPARIRHVRQRAAALEHVVQMTKVEEAKPILERRIDWIGLPVRIRKALLEAGFQTISDIVEGPISTFAGKPNIGREAIKEVQAYLRPTYWIGSGISPQPKLTQDQA